MPDILLVSYFSPKKFHFTLVSHMQNYALDIIENLYLANTILLEKRRQGRSIKATSYTEKKGLETIWETGSDWWLRSPGMYDDSAALVDYDGDTGGISTIVSNSRGVRPALHLSLFSFSPEEVGIVETAMEESEWDMVELGTWQDQPLYWRVLSVKDGDAYFLADRVLTYKAYHETDESVTWEKSTLRGWLNGDFYKNTFSENEKKGHPECDMGESGQTMVWHRGRYKYDGSGCSAGSGRYCEKGIWISHSIQVQQ